MMVMVVVVWYDPRSNSPQPLVSVTTSPAFGIIVPSLTVLVTIPVSWSMAIFSNLLSEIFLHLPQGLADLVGAIGICSVLTALPCKYFVFIA